ncbi:MAG: biotin transport system substrate-specific component [Clostridiales bacterium]|nr:biotin transport system substrate-specific component [Clostridiales bacterium]
MKARDMTLAALFAALTAIGAFIRIPMVPVAISLQLFFVMLAGLILGPKLGALSQIIYIAIGLIGIPIFTEGGGPAYVLKPSFGYLIGFIATAYISGWLSRPTGDKKVGFIHIMAALTAGILADYIIGVPYMYLVVTYYIGGSMTIGTALTSGFLIFLPGDIAKAIAASLIWQNIRGRLPMMQRS